MTPEEWSRSASRVTERQGFLADVAQRQHRIDVALGSYRFTEAEFLALHYIIGAGDTGVPLTHLGTLAGTSSGHTTRVTDALQSGGLVKRKRTTQDRRVTLAVSTPHGRETYEKVLPLYLAAFADPAAAEAEEEAEFHHWDAMDTADADAVEHEGWED